MSLGGLFDHRAEVWRPVERRGFGGHVKQTLEPVVVPTSGFNCAVVPPTGRTGGLRVDNIGPGETTRGRVDMYLARGTDVNERDVIRIVAGPEAVTTWRVEATSRPRGHHVEVVVEPWVGEIPAAVEAEA